MKKVYSILLAAVSLLFSANLYALDIELTTHDLGAIHSAIATAVENSATNEVAQVVNITLDGDVTIGTNMPIRVYAKTYSAVAPIVNIDMKGNDIEATASRAIELFKGKLTITNSAAEESQIKMSSKSGTYGGKEMIMVYGALERNADDWSVLTIGKNVKANAYLNDGKAIAVDVISGYYKQTGTCTTGSIFNFNGDVNDFYANHNGENGVTLSVDADKKPYFSQTDGTQLVNYATGWYPYGANGNKYGGVYGYAFGVKVTIQGKVYGTEYGIKVNGLLRDANGDYSGNVPYIKIEEDAEVSCHATTKGSVAVYSGGYGKIDIEGTAHGAVGVYIKSGDVTINGGNIYSENPTYFEATGTASGVTGSGSAIVVESNKNYAGEQKLTVSGNSEIKGDAGYGIEEVVTNTPNNKVEKITIEGGTIEAGDLGAVVVTDKAATNDKVVVVGGNIEDIIQIKDEDDNVTPATADDFFPTDATYISTTTKNAEGKDIIVITKLENGDINQETNNSVVATEPDGSIKWNNASVTTETIKADKTLTYLQISNDYAQTLIIGDPESATESEREVTLTVGRIVLGANAQIIVNAGSKLVVTGDQGIYSAHTNNIVLRTQEGKPAELLFSPVVVSNSHPSATVELVANSFTNPADPENDYRFQRFGVPTYKTVKAVSAKDPDTGADVQMFARYYENNGWTSLGYLNVPGSSFSLSKLNDPFGYYILQCNRAAAGTLVSFEGELVGNANKTLATGLNSNGWSTFTNSYSAKLDLESMLDMFTDPGITNIAVYYQTNEYSTDKTFGWNVMDKTAITFLRAQNKTVKLNPMEAFLIKDPSVDVQLSLNYGDMVWTPATTEVSPAPRRAPQDLTMASIRVLNSNDAVYMIQGDEFSTEIESGYDSEKYLAGAANIYVMNENKYATCATDNLENTYLGFACAEAGNYTISFETVAGEQFALRDLVTGRVVNMTEGATYEFYAAESNDYRFQIVGRANMPTDVEEVETAVKGNGIYSLTGQYMGNMSVWNTLPAGVYVVDGVKRVK